jgi:hypothetical protein
MAAPRGHAASIFCPLYSTCFTSVTLASGASLKPCARREARSSAQPPRQLARRATSAARVPCKQQPAYSRPRIGETCLGEHHVGVGQVQAQEIGGLALHLCVLLGDCLQLQLLTHLHRLSLVRLPGSAKTTHQHARASWRMVALARSRRLRVAASQMPRTARGARLPRCPSRLPRRAPEPKVDAAKAQGTGKQVEVAGPADAPLA